MGRCAGADAGRRAGDGALPASRRVLRRRAGEGLARDRKRGAGKRAGADRLAHVNAAINRLIPFRTDVQVYGYRDYWATPRETLRYGGDCEDIAILKLMTLHAAGQDAGGLRLWIVADGYHAVLAAQSPTGGPLYSTTSPAISRRRNFSPTPRPAPTPSISRSNRVMTMICDHYTPADGLRHGETPAAGIRLSGAARDALLAAHREPLARQRDHWRAAGGRLFVAATLRSLERDGLVRIVITGFRSGHTRVTDRGAWLARTIIARDFLRKPASEAAGLPRSKESQRCDPHPLPKTSPAAPSLP
jgi:hypothetical protein